MRYILILMIGFMFFGCNESSTSSNTQSSGISNTDTLQPIVNKAVQPPKPPAL